MFVFFVSLRLSYDACDCYYVDLKLCICVSEITRMWILPLGALWMDMHGCEDVTPLFLSLISFMYKVDLL